MSRWHNQLNPGIKSEEWTDEEEKKLFSMHDKFGNRWAEIARELQGRTDNCIKNHFYSTLRKAVRRLNRFIANTKDRGEMKEIKPATLSKIITVSGERWDKKALKNDYLLRKCKYIKQRLVRLSTDSKESEDNAVNETYLRSLILSIMDFSKHYKKKKETKKVSVEDYDDAAGELRKVKTRFLKRNIKKIYKNRTQEKEDVGEVYKDIKVSQQKYSKSTLEEQPPKSPNLKKADSYYQKPSYTENLLKIASNMITVYYKKPSAYHDTPTGYEKQTPRMRSQSRNLFASSSMDKLHMGPLPVQIYCKPSIPEDFLSFEALQSTLEHPATYKEPHRDHSREPHRDLFPKKLTQ